MPAIYVTDTHALIWYLRGSDRLGPSARAAFAEVASGQAHMVVPAIVLAELVILAEKRPEVVDLRTVLGQLRNLPGFSTPPLTADTALRIATLAQIPDIHDRLIVAEAMSWGAVLVTHDQLITRADLVPVVW